VSLVLPASKEIEEKREPTGEQETQARLANLGLQEKAAVQDSQVCI